MYENIRVIPLGRESGIRRYKYISAAIFKEAVHSDDP